MVKIFAIGATGYIGSTAVHAIASSSPTHTWTVLVRSAARAAVLRATLPPSTRYVVGDNSSTALITAESAAADVVINWASSDNEPLVRAVVAGMEAKAAPGYLIHVSGTGLLEWEDMRTGTYGVESTKVYDDWEGVGEVTSFPDEALHRVIDKVVLEAGARGKDLAGLFVRLVEEAAKGGGSATWGPEGYYFAENGQVAWRDGMSRLVDAAFQKGLIKSTEVESLDEEQAKKISPFALIMWGMNSRSKAVRARKLLGWHPVKSDMIEDAIQNWRWSSADEIPAFSFDPPKELKGIVDV
ncbi:putative nucleoside-diphosphate-sugar epimerase protein [Neofusicoccum parvum UCRNP2]|uniref:Putative nucleoside-diphosphate-sugar epimerase protein n=1 Tax=Botryosphaeria parva (strain UCR-NP2) TaxID=1287680 RepID=R1G506_BOTPV|nr:putative nucleoside-diphosphate-sugar epimerase protein [Neofusicoccum parvum UCRNP2]